MLRICKLGGVSIRFAGFQSKLCPLACYSTEQTHEEGPLRSDIAKLSKLRKETRIAFSHCNKALIKFNNDYEKAQAWLQEQAVEQGWTKALKLKTRPMSSGLIGVYQQGSSALLLEVNCETDFVANHLRFKELVSNLTFTCLDFIQSQGLDKQKVNLTTEEIMGMPIDGETAADLLAKEIGSIKENMIIRRAVGMTAPEGYSVETYCHAAGSYGAVAIFKQLPVQKHTHIVGTNLGLQIVGMFPQSIGEAPEIDTIPVAEPSSDSEKDSATDSIKKAAADNVNSMKVKGEVEETDEAEELSDVEDDSNRPGVRYKNLDESKLLHQNFMLDPTMKVYEWLQEEQTEVLDFARYHAGEELP